MGKTIDFRFNFSILMKTKFNELTFDFRKTQHLEELSRAVIDYADAVNILTLNVRNYTISISVL